jgi:hypothetical protein
MKRKLLALVLAVLLPATLLPMSAFAAGKAAGTAGDMSAVEFDGHDYFNDLQTVTASASDGSNPLANVITAKAGVTLAEGKADDGFSTLFDITGGDPIVRYIASASASGLTSATTLAEADYIGEEYDTQTLATGDILLIVDGSWDSEGNNTTLAIQYLALAITVSAAPSSNDSGEIDFDSEVTEIVWAVTVPTEAAYAINPFELGTSLIGGQVYGENYKFVNATAAPVWIQVDFEADLGDAVAVVADKSTLALDNKAITDKNAYVAVVGAAKVTTVDGTGEGGIVYDADATSDGLQLADGVTAPFVTVETDTTAAVEFILAAGTGDAAATPVESVASGVAAFTFYGELNSYADWEADDIAISATYTLNGIRPSAYTTKSATLVGANQVPTGTANPSNPSAVLGWTAGTAAAATYGGTEVVVDVSDNSATGYALPFQTAGNEVTNLKFGSSNATGAQWEVTQEGLLKLTGARITGWATGSKTLTFDCGEKTWTITISVQP